MEQEACKIKKAVVMPLALALSILLCGCAPRYASLAEAEAKGARFARQSVVEGIAVGGLQIAEAREKVSRVLSDGAAQTLYTVQAETETLRVSAGALGVGWDVESGLWQALCKPKEAARCPATLGAERSRIAASELAAAFDRPAKDAEACYADGAFVYTAEQAGRRIDTLALAETLRAAALQGTPATVQARVETVLPAYTRADAEADTRLRAEFSTSFAGSVYGKSNRVHNIRKAAAAIDGVVLAPGETFDMNAVLGPRNRENGWKEAAAIRDGAYAQEYGGGVCQVSTTLYNAVLLADLAVRERTHHSWPLGYVDIGRDATISTGGPNFTFVNDGAMPVYISACTDDAQKEITVRLYGRPRADGLRIELASEKVETLPKPKTEVRLDASLAPGTRVEARPARAGSISKTWKLYYDEAGRLVERKLVSTDKYRPIKGLVQVAEDVYYGTVATSAPVG